MQIYVRFKSSSKILILNKLSHVLKNQAPGKETIQRKSTNR
jgi:hypothetical protein